MTVPRRPLLRRIGPALLLSVVAALATTVHFATELLELAVAYHAKTLCSGAFIAGRTPAEIIEHDLTIEDLRPFRFIASSVDRDLQRVRSTLGPTFARTAAFEPDFGCVLSPTPPGTGTGFPARNTVGTNLGWMTARSAALDPVLDWAFAETAEDPRRRTRAVVILRHGHLIGERYAPGFGPDTPLPGWSMAKSVMNALVGVLIRDGRISLQSRIDAPEWQSADDPRRAMTVEHLLHMESGLAFSEDAGLPLQDVTRMLLIESDAAAYAASRPIEAPPGTHWHYASGNTNLLSRFVRRRLGDEAYWRWPRDALFEPLGMRSAVLERDPSGTFLASSFLYATARDWARFGQLYLQDGVWNGRRLLPEAWVAYSTRPAPSSPNAGYAAHFWLKLPDSYTGGGAGFALPTGSFHAVGHEGQFISVIPSHGLVVVRLGLTRDPRAWRQDAFLQRVLDALVF